MAIAVGAVDASMCEMAQNVLGVGHIRSYTRRHPHFDDETVFAVQSVRDLVAVVVPFLDAHMPPCKKRDQYLVWRHKLIRFWNNDMKRRRPCTEDGCDKPQRGRGVCRRHYYVRYGK
jgi:hypothetical protein